MKTTGLILIYYTRLKGDNKRGNMEICVFFGTQGRLTMFGIGHACFITWSRTFLDGVSPF